MENAVPHGAAARNAARTYTVRIADEKDEYQRYQRADSRKYERYLAHYDGNGGYADHAYVFYSLREAIQKFRREYGLQRKHIRVIKLFCSFPLCCLLEIVQMYALLPSAQDVDLETGEILSEEEMRESGMEMYTHLFSALLMNAEKQ